MTKLDYRVKYHVICVIYFSDIVPTSSQLSEAWKAMEIFGHLNADVSYLQKDGKKPVDISKIPVGDHGFAETIKEKATEWVSFGASSVNRHAHNAIIDSDLNFGFTTSHVWHGRETPGSLSCSFSGQVLESLTEPSVLNFLREWFWIADQCKPGFGLVDISATNDSFAGSVYGTAWPRTAPLSRWVERDNWFSSGFQLGNRVRNVYWGNYLSSAHLELLGGRECFIDVSRRKGINFDGSTNINLWEYPNGLFLSLCKNPVDCQPFSPIGLHPAAANNLQWLLQEFRRCGAFSM